MKKAFYLLLLSLFTLVLPSCQDIYHPIAGQTYYDGNDEEIYFAPDGTCLITSISTEITIGQGYLFWKAKNTNVTIYSDDTWVENIEDIKMKGIYNASDNTVTFMGVTYYCVD